jgi:hypothetical protein
MNVDKRCCGSGSCILNDAGECWCGQVWNGTEMIPSFFINEAGLRISCKTGGLYSSLDSQMIGLKRLNLNKQMDNRDQL